MLAASEKEKARSIPCTLYCCTPLQRAAGYQVSHEKSIRFGGGHTPQMALSSKKQNCTGYIFTAATLGSNNMPPLSTTVIGPTASYRYNGERLVISRTKAHRCRRRWPLFYRSSGQA